MQCANLGNIRRTCKIRKLSGKVVPVTLSLAQTALLVVARTSLGGLRAIGGDLSKNRLAVFDPPEKTGHWINIGWLWQKQMHRDRYGETCASPDCACITQRLSLKSPPEGPPPNVLLHYWNGVPVGLLVGVFSGVCVCLLLKTTLIE